MKTQAHPVPTTQAAPVFTTVGPDGQAQTLGVPNSRAEIRNLIRQREAISDQLTNVSERRSELSTELQGTVDEVARTGLEQRISLLDKRILQLETDLATTGQQLALAPASLVSSTGEPSRPADNEDFAKGIATGGIPVLAIVAVVLLASRGRHRRIDRKTQPQLPNEALQRLERLEQGMEAIAIEIERVSEGQRFVTKLLSTRENPAPTETV
ncbi:MAG TPA: hypothetical protein VHL12_05345 [Gemmatimonadaceae bacterium]|jgi:hypothetical protein|nr:hypothetical protein [Gemmatimonadaceae bacterium]